MTLISGTLSKLTATLDNNQQVQYKLPIGEHSIALNPYLGKKITLLHTGKIHCLHCHKPTKKSYAQGHCYVCMTKLASCDMCIMKPETCHFEQGTCREPDWAQSHCMVDHYVYLSNTSDVKVGITRHTQIPTRWIDQGATQGLPIFKTKTRHISGLIEVALAQHIADKTNWRTLLKEDGKPQALEDIFAQLLPNIQHSLDDIKNVHGEDAFEILSSEIASINYPVDEHPSKITSHNFDKNPIVSGILKGIKGQYLLLDTGVINIRKFTSYDVEFSD